MRKKILLLAALGLLVFTGCKGNAEQTEDGEEEIVTMPQDEEEKEEIKEYEVKLSDTISDFQFAINGEIYSLPSRLETWKGWEYHPEREDTRLDTESYIEGETIVKEDISLNVDMVNLEGESQPLKECYVGGIVLEYGENGPVYQLPGNITMGKAVLNEVVKAYGTPTDEYEEKEEIYVTYEYGVYKEAEFVFDIQNEILARAELKNYRTPENENEEISKEEPEAVRKYKEPEELSHNPADYIASYGGSLYKIPAPVSEFTKNGWDIAKDGSDSYVKSGRHGYVTLEKDGHTLYAVVKNYGEQTVEIQHSFVTNISGDFDVNKVPISVGKDITLGISEDNMKILLGGSAYEIQEEENGTSYYLYSDETKKNFIHIFVDKDLKLVREIEISNSPETLFWDSEEDEQNEPSESHALIDEEKLPEDG